MKCDIRLDCRLVGLSARSCKQGERVPVIQREFTSSEDGELFIRRLEEFPSFILNKLDAQHNCIIPESSVDNMLILLRRDHSAQVYVNAPTKALMRVKRAVDAGETIYRDDIADVCELAFHNIQVPCDVGVMVLFSVGWRKGFYYDLAPLSSEENTRDYDLHRLLGGYYAYLLFQEKFKIADAQWQSLFANGWFPFITLKNELVNEILAHNREGWNVDDLLPKVRAEISNRLPEGLRSWQSIAFFAPHIEFIGRAAEHYERADYLSCISVLFPRIEGILRGVQSAQDQDAKATQKELAGMLLSAGAKPKNHEFSLLLPLRFNQYLTEVYFAGFDPRAAENCLSRHTIAHGVARASDFNLKGATLGFLILDQLSYYFS